MNFSRSAIPEILARIGASLGGAVVSALCLLYGLLTGRNVSWGWILAFTATGVAVDAVREVVRVKKGHNRPKLVLHIDPTWEESKARHVSATSTPFVLQVESEAQAHGVRIASEDAVGPEHGRLSLIWTPQSATVGRNPIPVSLFLEWHKGSHSVSFTTSQIREFMRQVVGKKEVIAVVSFKDLDGNDYSKRFRIYEERDGIGFLRIRCEPLRDLERGRAT